MPAAAWPIDRAARAKAVVNCILDIVACSIDVDGTLGIRLEYQNQKDVLL